MLSIWFVKHYFHRDIPCNAFVVELVTSYKVRGVTEGALHSSAGLVMLASIPKTYLRKHNATEVNARAD